MEEKREGLGCMCFKGAKKKYSLVQSNTRVASLSHFIRLWRTGLTQLSGTWAGVIRARGEQPMRAHEKRQMIGIMGFESIGLHMKGRCTLGRVLYYLQELAAPRNGSLSLLIRAPGSQHQNKNMLNTVSHQFLR